MYIQKEKPKENKNRVIANVVQKKRAEIEDNRPDAIRLRKLQLQNHAPMRSILQGEFEEKKKNNTFAMRGIMKTHRQAESKWNYTGCQKNFAVNTDNTAMYGFSDEGGHSERNLMVVMLPSHSIGDPVNIHTERETCVSCYELLKKTHDDAAGTANAFDMNISYTVEYPGDGDSKDKLYEYYNTKSDMA